MGFEWRRHNTGLGLMNTTTSYEEDHVQDTLNNSTTPSVSAFSRLLRHDQQGQSIPRRHSSVDESLYGSRPGSQLHPIKRPASIHSPVLAQFEEEPGREQYNALIATPEFEIRDLDQYVYRNLLKVRAFTKARMNRFPHSGGTPRTAAFPKTENQMTSAVLSPLPPLPLFSFPSSGSTTPMKPRPKVDRSMTSYHTAHYSVSEYDEDEDRTEASNMYPTPVSSRTSPSKPLPLRSSAGGESSTRNSPSKPVLRRQQTHDREMSPSYFSWRESLTDAAGKTGLANKFGGLISPASSSAGALATLNGQLPTRTEQRSLVYGSDSEEEALFSELASPTNGTTPAGGRHIEELMDELRDVSAELASSIRREMDLEDELERFRSEPGLPNPSRRTSDYFSESGTSSIKLPTADSQSKIEALETMRRKVEQEKARLKLAMAEKAEADMIQRRALEMHVQSLEEQLQGSKSMMEDSGHFGLSSQEDELEISLAEARQHLADERQMKQQVEQLLQQLRLDHEACLNERDNLKEETVPSLRARLEGLESESTDLQKLQYENSQLQQELQTTRNENQTLVEARRLQIEQSQRFKSFAEEDDYVSMSPMASPRIGMTRSQSIARSRSLKRPGSMLTSPNPSNQPPPLPSDSLRDVEDQRDALHMTLRTLLTRQDVLNRMHAKQVRILQIERDEALRGLPSSSSLNQQIQKLRSNFTSLRERADEASEQKWQCEKGLSGLRMDLERTQQETESMKMTNNSPATIVAIEGSMTEQHSAAQQIVQLEETLRAAEEKVATVSAECEEALTKQEEHVRTLKEAELEKRTRKIGRMAMADKRSLGPHKKAMLVSLREGMTDAKGCVKEFGELGLAVQALENVVAKSEHEIQALMSRLNELHEELSALH